jgi:quercetin dioxygenase-like cupin family protein
VNRTETIIRGDGPASFSPAPGVGIRLLATGEHGSIGIATALARFSKDGRLPYHTHPYSEIVVVVEGVAEAFVEGRRYRMAPYDAIHIPKGTAHSLGNDCTDEQAVLLSAFPSANPTREFVPDSYGISRRENPDPSDPERLTRFESAVIKELLPGANFRDLFSGSVGSHGLCGGHGVCQPGIELPMHFHRFDESVTIVTGTAICDVAGTEHSLSNLDTAAVPGGRPHRFVNRSDRPMSFIWIYAADEYDRTIAT